MEAARDLKLLQDPDSPEVSPESLEPSAREVARLFARDGGDYCQAGVTTWCLLYYANFAIYAAGWLPLWAYVLLHVVTAVRSGNWMHRGYHAPPVRSRLLRMLRWLSFLPSPLTLGTSELQRNHLLHHAHTGKPKDPDGFLMNRSWWRSVLNALIQPEYSVVEYVRRNGLSRELALKQLFNIALLTTIGLVAGLKPLLVLTVTMRALNTVSWWTFVWGLHHERYWGNIEGLPMPGVVRFIYGALFSQAHLNTILFHTLHHRYPTVGDMDLPRLRDFVRAAQGARPEEARLPATAGTPATATLSASS
jgi:fatty acid desaturase